MLPPESSYVISLLGLSIIFNTTSEKKLYQSELLLNILRELFELQFMKSITYILYHLSANINASITYFRNFIKFIFCITVMYNSTDSVISRYCNLFTAGTTEAKNLNIPTTVLLSTNPIICCNVPKQRNCTKPLIRFFPVLT